MEFKEFGNRIKLLRKSLKLSQGLFAKKLGISTRTLAGWEAEESFPPENKLHFIADILKINLPWLIDGSGEKTIPIQETKLEDEVISNSIELRIKKLIESKLNRFQHEIIFLYDSLEYVKIKGDISDLIHHLEISKITKSNLFLHVIRESHKKSAIDFLLSMNKIEQDFIVENLQTFRKLLWDSIAWSNKFFHKSPDVFAT